MKRTIEQISNEFESAKMEMQNVSNKINELLTHHDVKEYITLTKENAKLQKKLEEIELELKEKQMSNCNHIFVNTSANRSIDFEMRRGTPVFCCLKCGLTNLYDACYDDLNPNILTPLEEKMGKIYTRTKENGIVIQKNHIIEEVESLKTIVTDLQQKFPNDTNEEIANKLENILNEKTKTKVK